MVSIFIRRTLEEVLSVFRVHLLGVSILLDKLVGEWGRDPLLLTCEDTHALYNAHVFSLQVRVYFC